MDKTTVYLPKELHESLQNLARRTGRPQAQIIREAIERYVDNPERPWPMSFGMGSDSEVTSDDIDDWLRDNWQID